MFDGAIEFTLALEYSQTIEPIRYSKRNFPLTITLPVRPVRQKKVQKVKPSKSEKRTRTDIKPKTTNMQNDDENAVQKTLPIAGVAETETASPQRVKPVAIRPRRRPSRREERKPQKPLQLEPPAGPDLTQRHRCLQLAAAAAVLSRRQQAALDLTP